MSITRKNMRQLSVWKKGERLEADLDYFDGVQGYYGGTADVVVVEQLRPDSIRVRFPNEGYNDRDAFDLPIERVQEVRDAEPDQDYQVEDYVEANLPRFNFTEGLVWWRGRVIVILDDGLVIKWEVVYPNEPRQEFVGFERVRRKISQIPSKKKRKKVLLNK